MTVDQIDARKDSLMGYSKPQIPEYTDGLLPIYQVQTGWFNDPRLMSEAVVSSAEDIRRLLKAPSEWNLEAFQMRGGNYNHSLGFVFNSLVKTPTFKVYNGFREFILGKGQKVLDLYEVTGQYLVEGENHDDYIARRQAQPSEGSRTHVIFERNRISKIGPYLREEALDKSTVALSLDTVSVFPFTLYDPKNRSPLFNREDAQRVQVEVLLSDTRSNLLYQGFSTERNLGYVKKEIERTEAEIAALQIQLQEQQRRLFGLQNQGIPETEQQARTLYLKLKGAPIGFTPTTKL